MNLLIVLGSCYLKYLVKGNLHYPDLVFCILVPFGFAACPYCYVGSYDEVNATNMLLEKANLTGYQVSAGW